MASGKTFRSLLPLGALEPAGRTPASPPKHPPRQARASIRCIRRSLAMDRETPPASGVDRHSVDPFACLLEGLGQGWM